MSRRSIHWDCDDPLIAWPFGRRRRGGFRSGNLSQAGARRPPPPPQDVAAVDGRQGTGCDGIVKIMTNT